MYLLPSLATTLTSRATRIIFAETLTIERSHMEIYYKVSCFFLDILGARGPSVYRPVLLNFLLGKGRDRR